MKTLFLVLMGLLLVFGLPAEAAANGDDDFDEFEVEAGEFDPGRTRLVQGEWLSGIGCPTNARVALPNEDFTEVGGFTTFTDPACLTGDERDRRNTGLLLAKTGPTANFAAAVAELKGVRGITLTELGYDIRKPGADTSLGPRGSHCGAGAPRFNVETKDGGFFFIGCNSPPATTQIPGVGFIRLRWGTGTPGSVMGFNAAAGFALEPITGEVKRITIVFDEGYDTGSDNFGLAVLDNIDVNGVLVGRGDND